MKKIRKVKRSQIVKIDFFTFFCSSLIFFLLTISLHAQSTDEFDKPWLNKNIPIILDTFHKNSIDWNKLKEDKRVLGIIHKATEGEIISDPKYEARKNLAKKNGYKWGSFHLLKKGKIIEQAEFYLSKIGKNNFDEVMALDVECTKNSKCNIPEYKVSADEIKIFLAFIKQKTGRYPIFYGNQSVVKDLSENFPNDELLAKIPLWYARFKSKVDDFPKGIWKSYTFWQFSSEINCEPNTECLYSVPGTLSDMDINVYNGTIKELKKNWANIGKLK